MSRTLLPLLTALLWLLFGTGCTEEPAPTLKVISYNIRLSSADDGPNSWPHRREGTLTLLAREQPDLLGIQEGELEQVRFLEEQCPDYARLGVGRDDGAGRGEIMAIFYRRDRFELLDSTTFWLSETPDRVSRGWDAACNRTATWGVFRDRRSGRLIGYLNTHLDHQGATARAESIRLLVDRLQALAPTDAALIVGGDFNSPTDDAIFRPLDSLLYSARDTSPTTDCKGSYHAFGALTTDAPMLDHLFYRGLQPLAFRTLDGDYSVPYLSDHYPVEALFRL